MQENDALKDRYLRTIMAQFIPTILDDKNIKEIGEEVYPLGVS